MSLGKFIIIVLIGTLLSCAAFIIVLTQMNPDSSRFVTVTAFSVSLGFATAGILSLLGFGVRVWLGRQPVLFRALQTSVRQGVLVAVFLEVLLVLQAMRWLAWWNALPLSLFFILLEAFFLAQEGTDRQTRNA
jgi:hypothetical protein